MYDLIVYEHIPPEASSVYTGTYGLVYYKCIFATVEIYAAVKRVGKYEH